MRYTDNFLKEKKKKPKTELCCKVSNRTNHSVNKRYFKEWYTISLPSALKKEKRSCVFWVWQFQFKHII